MNDRLLFSLTDGRQVEIDGYSVSRTYGGMLEGLPTRDGNEAVIRHAQRDLGKLWGKRKVHVVQPKVTPITPGPGLRADAIARYPNAERLPEFMCMAWASSFKTILPSGDACGSHAFLIWFQDLASMNESIIEQVKRVLSGLSWAEVAEDWDA